MRIFRCLVACLLLSACSAPNPAPLEDRSTEAEQNRPEVVRGGETVQPGRRTDRAARERSDTEVGSSATVSRGVSIGTGITRSRIGARPLESETTTRQRTDDVPRLHTVERGETLYSIAWRHGMDYRRLALANDLDPPYTIYPGQELRLDDGAVRGSDVDSLPEIPPSPAGGNAGRGGDRPAAAAEGRRTGQVARRAQDGISWQWPVDGGVSAGFNNERRGVDIATDEGSPVYAAADGDVVYAGRGIQGAGNLIIVRHSARHLSAYMHNRRMLVSAGARIRAGDRIGEVGPDPDGEPVLHFEIRVDGQPVNPTGYLPAR